MQGGSPVTTVFQPDFRPVRRLTHWLGAVALLVASCGCGNFWHEITSNERDWRYISWGGRPDPLEVLRDSKDHTRRAQALGDLAEPSNLKDRDVYLNILATAAKDDREPLCRLAAINTLGNYKDPRAARALEEIYQQPRLPFQAEYNHLIRKQSLAALEKTGDKEAKHLLVRVARQPGPPTDASLTDRQQTQDEKIIAIRALGKYREPDCVDTLVYVLRTEKDVALRDSAAQSLETITGKAYSRDPQQWQAAEGAAPPLPVVGDAPGVIQRVLAVLPK